MPRLGPTYIHTYKVFQILIICSKECSTYLIVQERHQHDVEVFVEFEDLRNVSVLHSLSRYRLTDEVLRLLRKAILSGLIPTTHIQITWGTHNKNIFISHEIIIGIPSIELRWCRIV